MIDTTIATPSGWKRGDVEGRAVVSLNDCRETRELYRWWNVHEVDVTYTVGGEYSSRKKANKEVILINI